jgi:hypothetical protein
MVPGVILLKEKEGKQEPQTLHHGDKGAKWACGNPEVSQTIVLVTQMHFIF